MVNKVTQQFNGAPIPTFIYTNDTVRAICAKSFLPFELCKIAMGLQQITQWFSYDVVITCEVVAKDKLNEIEQGREEPNPSPSLDVIGKTLKLPLPLPNKLNNR